MAASMTSLEAEKQQLTTDNTRLLDENEGLRKENEGLQQEKTSLEAKVAQLVLEKENLQKMSIPFGQRKVKVAESVNDFTFESVQQSNIKKLMTYYTGFTHLTLLAIFQYLVPNTDTPPFTLPNSRKDAKRLSLMNQFFLVMCRLRNGFDLKDLAFRFNIRVTTSSTIFKSWIDYMYLELGCISYWPHRDTIISSMPPDYKRDFPTSLCIIDGTEIKIQKPSALKAQSQCYSDYKGTTTLKCLVGIDPRGTVIFVSELFSGSISDKEICKQSGFYKLLQDLKNRGFIQNGDAIMADKGFTIEDEHNDLGIKLNIPPFAPSKAQMSPGDVAKTRKIAAHRIHVERSINRIKNFKYVGRKVPVSGFSSINQAWCVCTYLTNYHETLVRV